MTIELSGILLLDGIAHTIRVKYDNRTQIATVEYPLGQGRAVGSAHSASIGAAINFIIRQLDGSEGPELRTIE